VPTAGNNATGSSEWQVILEVEPRRLDALGTEEPGNLRRVPHLANHDVPQQAIHGVALFWRVVHDYNPLRLVVGQRGAQVPAGANEVIVGFGNVHVSLAQGSLC
jgi:hypothetical protein